VQAVLQWTMHDRSREANKETIVHCARLCIRVSQCKYHVSRASAKQLRHAQQNEPSHDLTKIKQTKTVREYVLLCASVNQPFRVAKMTKYFTINHFSQELINSIGSTVTGNKSVRRCKKICMQARFWPETF